MENFQTFYSFPKLLLLLLLLLLFHFLSSSGSSSFIVSCPPFSSSSSESPWKTNPQADKEKPHNLVSGLTTTPPPCLLLVPDLIKYLLLGERRECVLWYLIMLCKLRKNKAEVQNLLQPALPACLLAPSLAQGDFRRGSKVQGPMNSSNLIDRKL